MDDSTNNHEHDHHDISREELFKPYKPPLIVSYTLPVLRAIFDAPVTFFRENIVEKVRKPYPYYHRRYTRVPNIDECTVGDRSCFLEADLQFTRDRMVDANIVRTLRKGRDQCIAWYRHDAEDVERFCKDIMRDFDEARVNYFIKYGDLAWNTTVLDAFMKQKHRMLWERKYGPVGSRADDAQLPPEKEENMFTILRRNVSRFRLPKQMDP